MGVEVDQVFPLAHCSFRRRLVEKAFWHSVGRNYLSDRDPELLHNFARQARLRLPGERGDVVFSPGTLTISFLDTELPITFCADASFAMMLDYYESYSRLAASQVRFAEKAEAATLQKAALAIYPSEWAARGAINHYGIPEERVAVLPFGANFGKDNRREDVANWVTKREFDEVRLLFVGREWKRKGGDIVLETARLLHAAGLRVRLDVVGTAIPWRFRHLPFVYGHGLLSRANHAELAKLESLFRQAHFLFVPSRAEAYGMVYCEGNAFGLPGLATATGGVSGVIREGVNGFLLALDAEPADYVCVLSAALGSPESYRRLAMRSYDEFAGRLNWRIFCRRYLELLDKTAGCKATQLA
jgi:glycosyltransferase involved in cell wall biosynthesis